MRDQLLALLRHFMTPDDHRGDPAGFVATQAAHFGAIGVPFAWVALAIGGSPILALGAVAVGYGAIETAQARFGPQSLRDAATDTCFVLLGASFFVAAAAGAHVAAAVCLASALGGVIWGASIRHG